MITQNVDFCKNELRFMPQTFFHLNPILLHQRKITRNNFNFICEKLEPRIVVPKVCRTARVRTCKTNTCLLRHHSRLKCLSFLLIINLVIDTYTLQILIHFRLDPEPDKIDSSFAHRVS